MNPAIAIVGMACRYPDATTPQELWENALSQRRAFRRIPSERLRLEDYHSPDPQAPDRTYATQAAVIEGYTFDRVRYRVVGTTYRSADLAHWLALDVASDALADAGFPDGRGLERETTGVVVGNTLTGEFSRANVMRLRWPYIRRVVEAALTAEGWAGDHRQAFLKDLEKTYKRPFAPVGDESLAGGLSNTIAGRICNQFDLKGGGYTVDGACAASLLAVTHASSALTEGDLDVALAGGVDLSLDPFELVGFAKTGALAVDQMRVYDARSAGFWPGEGCGMLVLMRLEDALARKLRIYATIRGWGVSSDGSGGITRPEEEGQLLALRRAYRRAGYGIETVGYFEGHGTGTEVGDATELRALSRARREAAPELPPVAIGSIKANIGHTKAAAGVAGLIKATMSLYHQVLPPTTGCERPHAELSGDAPALRVLSRGESWPADAALRAGVNAMGFGGINSHISLEAATPRRQKAMDPETVCLLNSAQDAELFLLGGRDAAALNETVRRLSEVAVRMSQAELVDLAAGLALPAGKCGVRAAIVASVPSEFAAGLERLAGWLEADENAHLDVGAGVFLGSGEAAPRVAFLFPGQGSPSHLNGGAMRRRFSLVDELYTEAELPSDADGMATEVAQPAIITATLGALDVLRALGVTASVAVGHSLGELAALYWAGAFDRDVLLRIARARGKAMAELGSPTGSMAGFHAGREDVERLSDGESVIIAGLNSPHQTVISGESRAVAAVMARAQAKGVRAVRLPVSHAFHSPLVAAAAPALGEHLARESFRPLKRSVLSTITGTRLDKDSDVAALLCRQVTSPVRFLEAARAATEGADMLIEVGPGEVLSGMVAEFSDVPAVALDAGGPSLRGFLRAAGAAYVLGMGVKGEFLRAGRFARPFDIERRPKFFINPCERAPISETEWTYDEADALAEEEADGAGKGASVTPGAPPLEVVRQLVAARAELPVSAVKDENRLLGDLHLTSIAVGQLVADSARRLGLSPPVVPTDYATATVAGLAEALEDLVRTGGFDAGDDENRQPPGVEAWIRPFVVELIERPRSRRQAPARAGGNGWRVLASEDHPLEGPLKAAFAGSGGGGGVVLCLPRDSGEALVGLLLEAARAVAAEEGDATFVVVQQGGGGAALARTLHFEVPDLTTCVVDVPFDHPDAADWVLAEAMNATSHTEAHFDTTGRRFVPFLRLLRTEESSDGGVGDAGPISPLGGDDVLLVTGGGRGIAAECALALARETGVRLALLGRSTPDANEELSANLERFAAAEVSFRYIPTDVLDAGAVRAAVEQVESELGPVTAVLHGAGLNVPQLLASMDEAAFRDTLRPKLDGLENVLAVVDADRLRVLVTFGSIIARTGMQGEGHYAVANDWLGDRVDRWGLAHPHCHCLTLEWSVWAGVGMGERLGRVESLVQQGITPIPVEEGIRQLQRLLVTRTPTTRVVVTGRFGSPPTLRMDEPDMPLLRFLDKPRAHYPGVEFVLDVAMTTHTDPYLEDHVFSGERLFPAVMGLEAMAQVAMTLTGRHEPPVFEDVKFERPVVVPQGETATLRLAALVRIDGRVDVVVRSKETGFQVDHFSATCVFPGRPASAQDGPAPEPVAAMDAARLEVDPQRDLYGGILFHAGRFRRLRSYHRLMATECQAEITPGDGVAWFERYLPRDLVLGDPGARDAAIHAIQACIPHATILPIGVERILPVLAETSGPRFVRAFERSRNGDTFVYDLEVVRADGAVCERWEGLSLRTVAGVKPRAPWIASLLGPYIERRVGELIPGAVVRVFVERNAAAERRTRSDRAIRQVLGAEGIVYRRPDGKPDVATEGRAVSAAHAGDLTLAVAGPGPVGCDVEPVSSRTAQTWRDLLGPERFALTEVLAREAQEDVDTAATRVWSACECLKKAGASLDAPLVLGSLRPDGWVLLSSGPMVTATFVAPVGLSEERLAFAVLTRSHRASL